MFWSAFYFTNNVGRIVDLTIQPSGQYFCCLQLQGKTGKSQHKTLNTVRPRILSVATATTDEFPMGRFTNQVDAGWFERLKWLWSRFVLFLPPPHCFLHAWLYVGPLYLQVLVQSASKTRGLYLDGFHCVWGSHAQRTFPGHLRSGLMWNFTLLHQIK